MRGEQAIVVREFRALRNAVYICIQPTGHTIDGEQFAKKREITIYVWATQVDSVHTGIFCFQYLRDCTNSPTEGHGYVQTRIHRLQQFHDFRIACRKPLNSRFRQSANIFIQGNPRFSLNALSCIDEVVERDAIFPKMLHLFGESSPRRLGKPGCWTSR